MGSRLKLFNSGIIINKIVCEIPHTKKKRVCTCATRVHDTLAHIFFCILPCVIYLLIRHLGCSVIFNLAMWMKNKIFHSNYQNHFISFHSFHSYILIERIYWKKINTTLFLTLNGKHSNDDDDDEKVKRKKKFSSSSSHTHRVYTHTHTNQSIYDTYSHFNFLHVPVP